MIVIPILVASVLLARQLGLSTWKPIPCEALRTLQEWIFVVFVVGLTQLLRFNMTYKDSGKSDIDEKLM